MQKKKLLLVDGNSVLNRAFYGVPPLTTKDGLFTNAVHGMMNIILRHLGQVAPDYAAVAFDVKAPTFRHKHYDQYKANRKGMPPELAMQLPYAKEAMAGLGFTVVELAGYEADDLLGTYAAQGKDAGLQVYVLTGDKDSLQLICEGVTVLLAGNKDTVPFDAAAFTEKYGVSPCQFVDVKALMGDSSDNIPGVAGIGEKTACKLIATYGSLDGVYAALDEMKPSAQKTKLTDGKESAYLSQYLARICTDAPVPTSLDEMAYTGYRTADLLSLCRKLELTAMIEKLHLTEDAPAIAGEPAAEAYTSITGAELVALPTEPIYTLHLAPFVETDRQLAVYLTDGTLRATATLSIADLLSFLSDNRRRVAVHESKPVHRLCIANGSRFAACAFDLTLAGYVLSPTDSDYTLARMSNVYLSRAPQTIEAEADCAHALMEVLYRRLCETDSFALFSQMELPTAEVLAKMELAGFSVDVEGLRAFGERLGAEAEALAESIYFSAGGPFNILSPKQLGEVLFERLGLPAEKKTKTGYSTNAEVLEKLRPYHPIVDMILSYRQLTKLRSTYAEGLVAEADANGRIHSTFHQTVTATGRLSSAEPNLQNIPVRTELGREFRRFFVPKREDAVLIDADYSQIELRLLAHLAQDERMLDAFNRGADIHTATAAQVFEVPEEAVTSDLRKRAKAVNFGIVYGISAFSLSQDIGVSRKQAETYIKNYFAKYHGIKLYLDEVIKYAKEHGYVATPYGRRRPIPELASPKATVRAFGERVAMNSPVQGMAADVMKLAMIGVDRALTDAGLDAHLILQVHDELIVEASHEDAAEAARILQAEMERAVTLTVPLVAETAMGKSWYACKS